MSYEEGEKSLSGQSLKLQGAELCYCLTLSSEPGLCAQQGCNGSSVCPLTISLHILKPVQVPADLNTMTTFSPFFPSSLVSSVSTVSLISKYNNRGGICRGDFGAELNSILTLMSNRTSQMVQDILRTVDSITLHRRIQQHLLHGCVHFSRLLKCVSSCGKRVHWFLSWAESLCPNTRREHHDVFYCAWLDVMCHSELCRYIAGIARCKVATVPWSTYLGSVIESETGRNSALHLQCFLFFKLE